MARRQPQPLPLALAEGTTTLWGLAALALVVVPLTLTKTPPSSQAILWLAVGAAVVALSWWWAFRYLRAQVALGKTLADLRALSPAAFERWVGARFKEQGWTVTPTGTHGTGGDHGIDLLATKPGEQAVVQCKKYGDQRAVGEPVLRDLYGAMTAQGATVAYLVTTGRVTEEARTWAAGKPIVIWDSDAVAKLSAGVTLAAAAPGVPASGAATDPVCPACGAPLVERRNRKTGEAFLGCSRYPACRHTEALAVVR